MSYSTQEKAILKLIKKTPRIHHNQLQQESEIPKKTFEKHLKSLLERGKIRSYDFEGKKHYLIRMGKGGKDFASHPLSHNEQIEWKIAWKVQESQEFFDVMEKSLTTEFLNESDVGFARFVFEDILRNVLSLTIHDAFLDPNNNPHNRFIKKYKALIKKFFEVMKDKEFVHSQQDASISETNELTSEKNRIKGTKKFKVKSVEKELEPFAEEISRLYSDEWTLDSHDEKFKEILAGNIEFNLSSLIIDNDKIKNLRR